jgi:hypothetical protein
VRVRTATASKVRLIYVAGKFTAPDRAGVQRNIAAAVAIGLEIARLGAMPVIPHANTSHPNFEAIQPYMFWIDGTLELLRRSDACVMVPGWEESNGAKGERAEAHRLGIPVFDTIAEFAESIGRRSRPSSEVPTDDRPTDPCPPMPDEERDQRQTLETIDDGRAAE